MKRHDIDQWRHRIVHWLLERLTIAPVLAAEESGHTTEMAGTPDWYFQSEVTLYAGAPTNLAARKVVGLIDVWADDHSVQLTGCASPLGWSSGEGETMFAASWLQPGELQQALDGLADWFAYRLPLPARLQFYEHYRDYPWQAESFPALRRPQTCF